MAILGVILMSPTLTIFLGFITNNLNFIQSWHLFGDANDPRVLTDAISNELIHQVVSVITLIPGVLVVRSAIKTYDALMIDWFSKIIRVFGVIQVLTFPVVSVIGVYVLRLCKHAKK